MTTLDASEAVSHFGRAIEARPDIRLVAVGGPTAVGKSTLSRRFAEEAARLGFRARVFEGDRFLVPQKARPHPARFPDDVYEIERFKAAVSALASGESFRSPFYERDGRHTGRLAVHGAEDAQEILTLCRQRATGPETPLIVTESGEVHEMVDPGEDLWILDSELSLLYDDLRPLYDLSYGIRASREVRRDHFLRAVRNGERYPYLTENEARAKIEGFWETDDALIEPTVDHADVEVLVVS